MFGKKPPGIGKSRIEGALKSSKPTGPSSAANGSSKRKSPRQKAWAPCRLTWPPNGRADGVCLDASETGARIRFAHKVVVPDRFTLICPRLGLNRTCELSWQDDVDAAVRFIP